MKKLRGRCTHSVFLLHELVAFNDDLPSPHRVWNESPAFCLKLPNVQFFRPRIVLRSEMMVVRSFERRYTPRSHVETVSLVPRVTWRLVTALDLPPSGDARRIQLAATRWSCWASANLRVKIQSCQTTMQIGRYHEAQAKGCSSLSETSQSGFWWSGGHLFVARMVIA